MIDMSLRKKILLSFLSLIIASSVMTITAVLLATNSSVKSQAQQKLFVGRKVFEQLLDMRTDQLFESAEVLTSDFGFKSAVLDRDQGTISSALNNHGARIGADLMMLASLDGDLIASTGPTGDRGRFPFQSLLSEAEENGGLTRTVMLSGHPYQVLMLPINAPIPKAWAVLGFKIDEKLANQLKTLTTLDVTFLGEDDSQRRFELTTLSQAQKSTEFVLERKEDWLLMEYEQEQFLALETSIIKAPDYHVEAILSSSLDLALKDFSPLKLQILFISLLALFLSAISAFVIARNISRPVNSLVTAAERISSGNYSEDVGFEGYKHNEIGKLAKSISQMQTGIADREDKILHQVYHDALTGLANRASIKDQIDELIQQSIRDPESRAQYALLQLNVKRFKQVNNTFGYQVGDQLLIEISKRLATCLDGEEVAARLGADEFLLVLHESDELNFDDRSRLIFDEMSMPYQVNALNIPISFAAGLTKFPDHGSETDALMRRADIALNESNEINKNAVRKNIVIYEPGTEEKHLEQVRLIADLKVAIKQGGLQMFYQPKLDVKLRKVTQVEALIRWIHPELGFIRPDEFIGLAEQSGLMPELSRWVIKQVLMDASEWRSQNIPLKMAVNLSAYDLASSDLPVYVASLLAEAALPADSLILEVTESAMIENPEHALNVLNQLKALGITLAIDDYGTGYSSLSQLKGLPVDELKIDMSFVLKLDQNQFDQAIVNSTIKMAHELGLTVVAEGVENRESWRLLEGWGCDKLQGYYIAKPQNTEDFLSWYKDYDPEEEYQPGSEEEYQPGS